MPKKKVTEVEGRYDVVILENQVVEPNGEVVAVSKDKPAGLVAYAAFDCNGEHYEPGDEFNPPAGWTRDANYDEFRGIQIKNSLGKDIGRAFNTPSGLQIVPVKEA